MRRRLFFRRPFRKKRRRRSSFVKTVADLAHGIAPEQAAFIASPAFLQTPHYKRWRYDVLDKYDARCALCGRTPQEHGIVINADHVKPRLHWPHLALEPSNGQPLCGNDCNPGKGNRSDRDWRTNPPKIQLSEHGARELRGVLRWFEAERRAGRLPNPHVNR